MLFQSTETGWKTITGPKNWKKNWERLLNEYLSIILFNVYFYFYFVHLRFLLHFLLTTVNFWSRFFCKRVGVLYFLVAEMTFCMSSGTINSIHSHIHLGFCVVYLS